MKTTLTADGMPIPVNSVRLRRLATGYYGSWRSNCYTF